MFEGNLFKAQEWQKTIDCDFLLSIELETWPESAEGWLTLKRNWPSLEESTFIGSLVLLYIIEFYRWCVK